MKIGKLRFFSLYGLKKTYVTVVVVFLGKTTQLINVKLLTIHSQRVFAHEDPNLTTLIKKKKKCKMQGITVIVNFLGKPSNGSI